MYRAISALLQGVPATRKAAQAFQQLDTGRTEVIGSRIRVPVGTGAELERSSADQQGARTRVLHLARVRHSERHVERLLPDVRRRRAARWNARETTRRTGDSRNWTRY